MEIYITKNVGEITFKRLRAIGRGYDVELIEDYDRHADIFRSLVDSDRHKQAIYAFCLALRALRLFQQIHDENYAAVALRKQNNQLKYELAMVDEALARRKAV